MIGSIAQYAAEGYPTFPTHNKRPILKGEDWRQSKIEVFPDPSRYPHRQFGVVLQDTDLVVDVDPRNGGRESWDKLVMDLNLNTEEIYSAMFVRTGGGGVHFYMKKPDRKSVV